MTKRMVISSLANTFLRYEWDWVTCFMFGSIVSATDPVAVVALLSELGAPADLGTLIDGEAVLNDGVAAVCFFVFKDFAVNVLDVTAGVRRAFARVMSGCVPRVRFFLRGTAGVVFAVTALVQYYSDTNNSNSTTILAPASTSDPALAIGTASIPAAASAPGAGPT